MRLNQAIAVIGLGSIAGLTFWTWHQTGSLFLTLSACALSCAYLAWEIARL